MYVIKYLKLAYASFSFLKCLFKTYVRTLRKKDIFEKKNRYENMLSSRNQMQYFIKCFSNYSLTVKTQCYFDR